MHSYTPVHIQKPLLESSDAVQSAGIVLAVLLQGVIVKVYEVNCWSYYTSEGQEVDLNLELSGVAPSKTLVLKTPQDPVIRWV